MNIIPDRHEVDVSLQHLKVLETILRERSLTRAAHAMDMTQPNVSKVLAKLRLYFRDPLFVRVGSAMEPTAKAVELAEPVRRILDASRALRVETTGFVPGHSQRSFRIFISDVGAARLAPPLMARLQRDAPGVRLELVQLDARQLQPRLESGEVDLAVGAFPDLDRGIRRRKLFTERHVAVVRPGHPLLERAGDADAFLAARHVMVAASGLGHAHREAVRVLEAAVAPENVVLRVPGFVAAAMVVRHTDAVLTLPGNLASFIVPELALATVEPPLELPVIEIAQYWHERFHRDGGNRWMRSVLLEILGRRLRERSRA